MPECYTHVRVATKALMRCGFTVGSQQAFVAGANGPDPFYMYKKWAKRPSPDLPALAAQMHREKTCDFIVTLLQYAITPQQQSYALGYITHYITDCTLHPYICAMSKSGMPYAGKAGQAKMEAALDSSLYYLDYRSRTVPAEAGAPVLLGEELAQVTTLLHDVILHVYRQDVPALVLADTYHDNFVVHKFMRSRTGLRKLWARLFAGHYRDRRSQSGIWVRMQPARPLANLPVEWQHPYTNEALNATLDEILLLAEQTSTAAMVAAMRYWLEEISEETLRKIIQNNNCYTGLPNEATGNINRDEIKEMDVEKR